MTLRILCGVVVLMLYVFEFRATAFVMGNTTSIVRFLTLLSYNQSEEYSLQPSWDGGTAALHAAQLAVDHVNEDKNTLPGYRVELINVDGDCDIPFKALTSFTQNVLYGPHSIEGVIGPDCSQSSLVVSHLTSRPEIALPSVHFAASPQHVDRNKYPYAYGILTTTLVFLKAIPSLIEYNKWENVAALYDSIGYIHLNQQVRKIISQEFRFVFLSEVYDTYFPLDALMKSRPKVVIMWASLKNAQKLLCVAHKRGMVFPRYQWVIPGYQPSDLVNEAPYTVFHHYGEFYNCTKKEMLQDHLLVSYRVENSDKQGRLVSGYTYGDILQHYIDRLKDSTGNSQFPYYYDSVWALVLALNMSIAAFNDSVIISSLQLGNREFAEQMKHNLDRMRFAGVSGMVDFDSATGFVNRPVDIFYINETTDANFVGFFSEDKISIITNNSKVFINTTRIVRVETVHPLAALPFLLVTVGLFVAIVFLHILSTLKRQHPSIKASSPALNHLIFSGCYIWTAAAIIYIVLLKTVGNVNDNDHTWSNCCHAVFVWLVPVGFTLMCGTLIAKTWRIYRIFIHFRKPGRLISNQVLIIMVLIQLGFDIAFGTVWSIIAPAHMETTEKVATSNQSNLVTYIALRSCVFLDSSGNRQSFGIVLLCIYKSLQMIVLFVLTLLTRNILIKRFSPFRLRMTSYALFVLYLSIGPPFLVLWQLNAEIHIDFILFCILFCSYNSIFFALVLLPPVLPILKQMSVSLLKDINFC